MMHQGIFEDLCPDNTDVQWLDVELSYWDGGKEKVKRFIDLRIEGGVTYESVKQAAMDEAGIDREDFIDVEF